MRSDVVDVRTSGDQPCPRCGSPLLLIADIPSTIANARGEPIAGYARIPLCAKCDADAPEAGPLIVFLAVHETITAQTAGQFARYADAWMRTLRPPIPDLDLWLADLDAWRRGDFDG